MASPALGRRLTTSNVSESTDKGVIEGKGLRLSKLGRGAEASVDLSCLPPASLDPRRVCSDDSSGSPRDDGLGMGMSRLESSGG